jgi:myo-inositol-1(or 4)-monophosphatase
MSLPDNLQFVEQVARQAGAIVLEHYGRVERLTKTHAAASAEPVTEADRAAQRHIVSALRGRFRGDGIIGEEDESGQAITFDCPDPRGRVWVIDPVDGTNNFVAGLGCFAVCIGLLERGEPVLGVVHDVTRGQSYMAARGHGAWLDARRISALPTPLSETTMLMLTSNVLTDGKCPGYPLRWVAQTHWKIRMLGSAALEAVQVAAGVAHGAVTVNGKLWDAAAATAIVLEAGGIVTDFAGRPRFPMDLHNYHGAKVPFLAAAPAAHAELLREIQK